MTDRTRWLFADRLGADFLDEDRPDQPVLLVESLPDVEVPPPRGRA